MTAPASGRSDFQSSAQWFTPSTFYTSTNYLSSGNLIEHRNTANWQAYRVSGTCQVNSGQVRVSMWDSPSKNILVDQHIIILKANRSFNMAYPITGPYVELYVDAPVAGNVTMVLQTSMSNMAVVRPTSMSMVSMWQTNFAVIPASTIQQFEINQVVPGDAWVYFSDDDSSGKVTETLEVYNINGNLNNRVAQGRLLVNPTQTDFIAPAAPMAMRINNTDTVSHQCSFCVILKG